MRTTKKAVRRECVLLLLLLLLLTCADSSLHDRDIGQRVKKWPALAAVTSPCRSRAGSRRACAHACTRCSVVGEKEDESPRISSCGRLKGKYFSLRAPAVESLSLVHDLLLCLDHRLWKRSSGRGRDAAGNGCHPPEDKTFT